MTRTTPSTSLRAGIDRLIITLNMSRVVRHVWDAVRQENTERLTPVFDPDHPIRSTAHMRTWYTGKPYEQHLGSDQSELLILLRHFDKDIPNTSLQWPFYR